MNKEQIIEDAITIFGNEEKALRWLNKRKRSLYGESPMELLNRDEFEPVKELLNRIKNT